MRIGGEITLVDGGLVRVSSPGAMVPGALVGGGLVAGLAIKPRTKRGGESTLVDGELVRGGSPGVAFVGGGLVGWCHHRTGDDNGKA